VTGVGGSAMEGAMPMLASATDFTPPRAVAEAAAARRGGVRRRSAKLKARGGESGDGERCTGGK